ncbi:hypothetical protein [Moorena sp. SIO4E2]|uniref:hypothetical protein n=1 Tax=Moorena sp. SIO4E2 TaxID=2607826 RepID=UPI00257BFB0A|nr:hypothetical protein [Moorena sp. SIO4E2]
MPKKGVRGMGARLRVFLTQEEERTLTGVEEGHHRQLTIQRLAVGHATRSSRSDSFKSSRRFMLNRFPLTCTRQLKRLGRHAFAWKTKGRVYYRFYIVLTSLCLRVRPHERNNPSSNASLF